MLYTIRTTSGREDILIDILSSKIKAEGLEIKALFHPAEIKGYVFVEGEPGAIHRATQGVMHARGLIEKPIRFDEIQHFLESKKTRIKLGEGDTVEIIGGPFRGEKGQIKRIDKAKDEITIELLEATIPIPVTISTEFVKILKRAKPEEAEEEKPLEEKEEEPEPEDEEKSVFDATLEEEKPEEETPAEKIERIEEKLETEEKKPSEKASSKPEEEKKEEFKYDYQESQEKPAEKKEEPEPEEPREKPKKLSFEDLKKELAEEESSEPPKEKPEEKKEEGEEAKEEEPEDESLLTELEKKEKKKKKGIEDEDFEE